MSLFMVLFSRWCGARPVPVLMITAYSALLVVQLLSGLLFRLLPAARTGDISLATVVAYLVPNIVLIIGGILLHRRKPIAFHFFIAAFLISCYFLVKLYFLTDYYGGDIVPNTKESALIFGMAVYAMYLRSQGYYPVAPATPGD